MRSDMPQRVSLEFLDAIRCGVYFADKDGKGGEDGVSVVSFSRKDGLVWAGGGSLWMLVMSIASHRISLNLGRAELWCGVALYALLLRPEPPYRCIRFSS